MDVLAGARTVVGGTFPTPADPALDRKLITGAVLFGAGWGLVGLCPGPALASLSYGGTGGLVFIFAMGIGMLLAPVAKGWLDRSPKAA